MTENSMCPQFVLPGALCREETAATVFIFGWRCLVEWVLQVRGRSISFLCSVTVLRIQFFLAGVWCQAGVSLGDWASISFMV